MRLVNDPSVSETQRVVQSFVPSVGAKSLRKIMSNLASDDDRQIRCRKISSLVTPETRTERSKDCSMRHGLSDAPIKKKRRWMVTTDLTDTDSSGMLFHLLMCFKYPYLLIVFVFLLNIN